MLRTDLDNLPSAPRGTGFAAATQPVAAHAIHTDPAGLTQQLSTQGNAE